MAAAAVVCGAAIAGTHGTRRHVYHVLAVACAAAVVTRRVASFLVSCLFRLSDSRVNINRSSCSSSIQVSLDASQSPLPPPWVP